MLWRTQLRNSAVQLITVALRAAGATTTATKDTPVMSGSAPQVSVYADDKKYGESGGSVPTFRTQGLLTIEVRCEKPTRMVGNIDQGASDASSQLDQICECIQNALFGVQGFTLVCATTLGSAVVTPPEDQLGNIVPGFCVMGGGAGENNYVETVDVGAGTVTLAKPICLKNQASGAANLLLTFGSFVRLYEAIDDVNTFTDYEAGENANHIASATIEIVGHTHEVFQPCGTTDLAGVNIYVDTVNLFDPNGTYTDLEGPFAGNAAPRTSGPDGRPEISVELELNQE